MKIPATLVVIAAFAITTLTSCQHERNQNTVQLSGASPQIINGRPVRKSEPAFLVTARILRKIDGVWYPFCTASIVAKDLILTAAHCLEYSEISDLRIGFGAQPFTFAMQDSDQKITDPDAKFVTRRVTNFLIHPKYNDSRHDYDLALIHLDALVPEPFHPVPLLHPKLQASIQEKVPYDVLLVGYGLISENPMKESSILRKTVVPARFEGARLITDQTGGSGGCNGDSGGPAFLEQEGILFLVGVTHGPAPGSYDCQKEGVWGNPNHSKEFLNEAATQLGSSMHFE